MAAIVLAICLSAPVASDGAGGDEPGYLQRALDRFAFEYEWLSLRLDLQLWRWSSQLQRAELEREVKARTGMTLEELVRDGDRRRFADPPWFLKVGSTPYVDIADHAGPGRARFEPGDFEPLCRTERRPRRVTLGKIWVKVAEMLGETP